MGKQKSRAAVLESPRFKVHLAATTPIAHNGVVIEAETAAEAWDKFCAMNGISGSSCERTITEVKE